MHKHDARRIHGQRWGGDSVSFFSTESVGKNILDFSGGKSLSVLLCRGGSGRALLCALLCIERCFTKTEGGLSSERNPGSKNAFVCDDESSYHVLYRATKSSPPPERF